MADAVYGIRDLRENESVARGISTRLPSAAAGIGEQWDIGSGKVLNGTSGNLIVSEESGFGLVLQGKGTRDGEIAVVARGTVTKADWMSNLNISPARGPAGTTVHSGFAGIYNILVDQIAALLPPKGRVHLVGHSLGGALANLLAAKLSMNPAYQVGLYTFGAPRVAPQEFCTTLERRLGVDGIHRVYDVADPVPMIPIFPYLHSPLSCDGIRVGASAGMISVSKHDIKGNYTRLVRGKEWNALARASTEIRNFRKIDELLDIAGIHVRIPGGSMGLWALNKALQAIIDVSFLVLGAAVALGETVLDKLAAMLMRAGALVKELGQQIMRFMEMVFKWTGRAIGSAVDLTATFLRYAIELLLKPIHVMARLAIDNL